MLLDNLRLYHLSPSNRLPIECSATRTRLLARRSFAYKWQQFCGVIRTIPVRPPPWAEFYHEDVDANGFAL